MNIDSRILGKSAILANNEVSDVDMMEVVKRLLLFDKYILSSVRLKEFPFFIKYFGFDGVLELLESGLIEIRCECLTWAQTGQTDIGGRPLPLYHYRFSQVDAHDRTKYISDCLRLIHDISGLKHSQHLKLKKAIVDCIQPLPALVRPRLYLACIAELQNLRLLRMSIDMAILSRLSAYAVPYTLVVHQTSEKEFRIESDLARIMKINDKDAHKAMESGLLGVAALSQAILEMEGYSAISGFTDHDLPLFRHKVNHLYELASSEKREDSFDRVIEIADIAEFNPAEQKISIEKLRKVRESPELMEFRAWLPQIGSATDEEIKSMIASIRARLGLRIGGMAGKLIRALITSGVLVKSLSGSIILNLCDTFLVNKLLLRTGIAAFVNDLYPSLFESRTELEEGEGKSSK